MHEAISRVWQDKDRLSGSQSLKGSTDKAAGKADDGATDGATHIQGILIEAINDYFESSFLPVNEKEAVKKQ